MLPVHPVSGFTCPVSVRAGSWHARHICPLELSRTRKFCATVSMPCTCGLWQLVHSIFPFTSLTAPVGSAVTPCAASDAARSGESLIGNTRLKGWDPLRLVVKTSMLFKAPLTGIFPNTAVCPTATVPSWQLKHRLLVTPSVGCVFPFCLYVVLVYGV